MPSPLVIASPTRGLSHATAQVDRPRDSPPVATINAHRRPGIAHGPRRPGQRVAPQASGIAAQIIRWHWLTELTDARPLA